MAAIFPYLDLYFCIATKWSRNLGFLVTYSALLMKTWRSDKAIYYNYVLLHISESSQHTKISSHSCRVSLSYRVKSAHKLKLTDKQLLQWLFPILLIMIIYLSSWTISDPPKAVFIEDLQGLRFKQCHFGWWDYSLSIGENMQNLAAAGASRV